MSRLNGAEAASLRRMERISMGALLVVGVALGALVWRALWAVRQEQQSQHQVLAERVFDEMERELSALIAREESRSFLHYRALYVPEGSLPGSAGLTRSPLATPPEDPAIVGYFQIDPDGSATTPLSSALTGSNAELEARVAEVLAAVSALQPPEQPAAQPEPQVAVAQAEPVAQQQVWEEPKSYPPKKSEKLATKEADPKRNVLEQVFDKGEDVTLREVEKSLNRGAEYRSQRKAVSKKEAAQNVAQFQQKELVSPYATSEAEAPTQSASAWTASSLLREAPPRPNVPTAAPRPLGMPALPAEIDVTLTPFQATDTGADRVVVWRDVTVGRERYRQGFVLARAALQRYLERTVFEPSGLADLATLEWDASEAPFARLHHTHRFAEPFGALSATLSVPQLARGGPIGELYILALAALVLITGLVSGVAVWRTASATVSLAERRNNFVAAVTHELKTPLTAIRLYAEMLRDGLVASDDKRHEYYETITAETERLTRLIQNVLDLARLERGNRPMAAAVSAVSPVLEEVAHTLGPHAREQEFEIVVEVAPGLPAAWLDRDALVQVLVNLVDNAIKFSRETTDRRVHLSAEAIDACVVVRVRDHGPGVPERQLPLVFRPFYRGERELTRRTQGTGIGLALVSGLVLGMGGQTRARNHPDGGFEVAVWLRAARPS